MKHSVIIISSLTIFVLLSEVTLAYTPVSRGCDERSCYPATGNLLIGRQDKLSATSTCGLQRKERYCILSHLDPHKKDEKCFWCDSTSEGLRSEPQSSHRVQSIVYRYEPAPSPETDVRQQYKTWWQAENGVENVTIQVDFEAEFHVTHLIITFKTFRPKAMYIEKSYDWGQTWKIHRYFASDCVKSFPGIHVGAPRYLNETVCQERYSRVTPSTLGTVIYRVLPPNINIHSPGFNPYSKEVQDLLKTTNLRIHFKELFTMGDENLETNRLDIKEKYYYSIYDMTVRGSCSCYGHAERCLPEKEEHKDIMGMVHGKCDCTHNTKGNNCEYCLDDYNDAPWLPATGKKKNECKKCNCHEHAVSCTFNPYVYAATGNVSGGVCDNCMHNTEGRQCEFCKEGFFQDPELDKTHPEICKPCDCEPDGTVDDGLCDSRTDEEEEMTAGQCHCKTYVGGPRCDRCQPGYWNFTLENPDGCQECTCNLLGTVNNDGCDQETGECTCKRFVIGRDCDQCMPEHYGLSSDPNGCKPCDCDIGGSYDNSCDVITGQCRCRPHVMGRRCDQIEDGYFSGALDWLLFESEYARGSQSPPTKVIKREPSPVPGGTTWTGLGFMQVFEGSDLTYDVPAIFRDLEYDLIVRYEHLPNYPNEWQNANVELIRIDGPPDPSEKCNQTDDGPIPVSFPPGQLYTQMAVPFCLEEGQRYQIKFTFDHYDPNQPDQKASILMDSIALLPKTESISFLDGDSPADIERVTEFQSLGCRDYFLEGRKAEEIPEECRGLLNSISFLSFEGGFGKACECDPTGSVSTLCDKYTGQCPCKKNVVGRRCDRCAVGTFGFGSSGCQPCNCHNLGALDPFCQVSNGQCNCMENAYGRRCDECQPGFWNFPNCQPCECNGHAITCDFQTGECNDCRDATAGFHCEVCLEGYYGDPRFGVNIPCRECPCPNTKASGHSFADRCYLDTTNNEPVCECEEGYAGLRCSVCADNYYGNPEIPGGSCVPCNCSSNWNVQDVGNCDPHSGECLKCLFNTEGFACQFCKPGFYGDAVNDVCRECVCNILGTDPNRFDCDKFTGDCHCLPNVEGRECDRCIENHWKIASGEGCEACDCDPVGSLNPKCNEYTGQCECKPGFGGRRCDQCEENFWGDPRVECYACNCNPQGSQSFQCDHATGKCVCLEGIGGEKCDECARGFVQEALLTADRPVHERKIPYGDLPQCRACGECFTNWDRILGELKDKTALQVSKAEEVKVIGATGAYTRNFEDMEKQLREVKNILNSASISNDELVGVQSDIDQIASALADTTSKLDVLDNDLANSRQAIVQGSANLDYLRIDADRLKVAAQDMKEKTTRLQEANVEGALNLTRAAKSRSDEAAYNVARIGENGGPLSDSEIQRKATERLMNTSSDSFTATQEQNRQKLQDIITQIENLEEKIPELNSQVCDGSTSADEPCDELCGGAGCGKCGGLSCLNGALSKAGEAVKSAEAADGLLIETDSRAEQALRDVTLAHQKSNLAANKAQEAYDLANEAKNRSKGETTRVEGLMDRINNFMNNDRATPEQVKELADQCLAEDMDKDTEGIQALADQINVAITSVTNVDDILEDTREPLRNAEELKYRADMVKTEAEKELEKAEKITQALSDAAEAQNIVSEAIVGAQENIDNARTDLGQISEEMSGAVNLADTAVAEITDLTMRKSSFQTDFIRNENRVKSAQAAAEAAKDQAASANSELYQLNNGFKNVSSSLEVKISTIGGAKDMAVDLQRRANDLASSASNKLANLFDVEKEFEESERRLMELSNELVSLNCEMMIHLQVIEDKSNYYRSCSPPGTWQPSTSCQCLPGSQEPTCTTRRAVYER